MPKGSCNCGAVEFEINTPIRDIYFCHCSICRRSTGTSGIPVVVVRNEDFQWTKGEDCISTWKKPNKDWQTWFCRVCGSPLPGKNDSERMFVPAGLITLGGDELKIAHHIWVDSKANWDEIGDKGKQHPFEFGG